MRYPKCWHGQFRYLCLQGHMGHVEWPQPGFLGGGPAPCLIPPKLTRTGTPQCMLNTDFRLLPWRGCQEIRGRAGTFKMALVVAVSRKPALGAHVGLQTGSTACELHQAADCSCFIPSLPRCQPVCHVWWGTNKPHWGAECLSTFSLPCWLSCMFKGIIIAMPWFAAQPCHCVSAFSYFTRLLQRQPEKQGGTTCFLHLSVLSALHVLFGAC